MQPSDKDFNQSWLTSFSQYFQIPKDSSFFPFFYLQLLIVAEILTTLRAHSLGLTLHSIVLIALLFHGAVDNNIRYRRFYLVLSLAPLMRVLSLSLPLAGRPLVEWYFWIGLMVYIGIFFAILYSKIPANRLGINLVKLPFQLLAT